MSIVAIMVDIITMIKILPYASAGYLEPSQTILSNINNYGILLVLTGREATSIYESLNQVELCKSHVYTLLLCY